MDLKKKVISKEQQENIKRYFSSFTSSKTFMMNSNSNGSPSIEFDNEFSRTLLEKRKARNIFEKTQQKQTTPDGKRCANSYLSPKPKLDESWMQVSDESFLRMEENCDQEPADHQKTKNCSSFDETQLFDVDPPSELWNQSSLYTTRDAQISPEVTEEDIPELRRPSTIIEETSSQMSSLNRGTDQSSESYKTGHDSQLTNTFRSTSSSSVKEAFVTTRKRRETFAMVKRKYKIFTEENDDIILRGKKANPTETETEKVNSEPTYPQNKILKPSTAVFQENVTTKLGGAATPKKVQTPRGTPNKSKIVENQFNNTLEAIDFFIEEGQRRIENNAQADLTRADSTVCVTPVPATPLFSCKRTKILNDVAAVEIAAFSRKGPLIDLFTSP